MSASKQFVFQSYRFGRFGAARRIVASTHVIKRFPDRPFFRYAVNDNPGAKQRKIVRLMLATVIVALIGLIVVTDF